MTKIRGIIPVTVGAASIVLAAAYVLFALRAARYRDDPALTDDGFLEASKKQIYGVIRMATPGARDPDALHCTVIVTGLPEETVVLPPRWLGPPDLVFRYRMKTYGSGCTFGTALEMVARAPKGSSLERSRIEWPGLKLDLSGEFGKNGWAVASANPGGCQADDPPKNRIAFGKPLISAMRAGALDDADWASIEPLPDLEIDYYRDGKWRGTGGLWWANGQPTAGAHLHLFRSGREIETRPIGDLR